MRNLTIISGLAFAASLALLTGCAHGPEAVEADYGNSVRHMMQAQTANPTAPADTSAIEGSDGQRLNTVMETYRKDVSKPEDVKKDIIINVGGSQ
jgi:type IV pilus biogenesis protein CpaD/CtpE